MRIAYISAGAASMYCGTCLHDNTLARGLIALGHDVVLMPTYTPMRTDEADVSHHQVHFGAINVYLQQTMRLFRSTPRVIGRLLDHPFLLGRVGALAGATRPADLAALTLSVLRGESGNQQQELGRLVEFVAGFRPDLVHLSNSLFLGFARALRRDVGCPIVCSLQGEDAFVDGLPPAARAAVRTEIATRAADVDHFLAPSDDYRNRIAKAFAIDHQKIATVPLGIDITDALPSTRRDQPFTVGYLGRWAPEKGLDLLCEGFDLVVAAAPAARLAIAGYEGPGERKWSAAIRARIAGAGHGPRTTFVGEVDRAAKNRFLASIDVLALPTRRAEAKGLPALEAMARGVPVVAPREGGFPELIEATGGGLLYPPNSARGLAEALVRLHDDRDHARRLGARGREAMQARFDLKAMAERTAAVFAEVVASAKLRAKK